MTKEEFIKISEWRNESLLHGKAQSNFLESEIYIQIGFNQFDLNREISEFAINSLNDFLNLNKSNFDWIKNGLWEACMSTFQNASYGTRQHVKDGQSEFEANKELFGIFNIEDSFKQATPRCVFIDNNHLGPNRSCFWLEYSTSWDIEHNVIFVFVDGKQYSIE